MARVTKMLMRQRMPMTATLDGEDETPPGPGQPPVKRLTEPMEAGAPGGAGDAQGAYDQVVSGLQRLAEEYPEANEVLTQIQTLWERWMGGAEMNATEGAAPV